MAKGRDNYGFSHGIRKFLLNCKALLKYSPNSTRHPKSKLVLVLSFPRSGTHALASMINHDAIGMHYYGEFFIFNQWSPIVEKLNKYIPFFSWRYFVNTKAQKRKWTLFKFEKTSLDPIKVLEKMMAFPGTHIIKIFPEHLHFETLLNIIEQFDPSILILRRNHLDRYVSLKKANATGVWHKSDSSDVQIEIDERELVHYQNKYDDWYANIKKAIVSRKVMDIGFEKLHDQETINLIQQFVSFDGAGLDSLPKAPTTKKMDKSSKIQDEFLASVGKKHSDFDFKEIA
jgi:hypothetical protein